jgi:hypothetical protein
VRISPVVARRNDRFGAGLVDRVEEVFGVIGPVGDDIVRPETLDQVCRIECPSSGILRQMVA